MNLSYDTILLLAFGGPTCAEEIRPFLARVTRGIPIPAERLEEVAHHYEAVGGRSPLNEITFRQALALQRLLTEKKISLPVYVGFRNASPFFAETLKQMAAEGAKRALGFILSSHQTEASWDRYQKNISDARAELGPHAPEFSYCEGWHEHPLFIQAWTELIETSLKKANAPSSTALVFTAHSLPAAMAARSPYVKQIETSVRLIAGRLGHEKWSLAYQSRSGKPTDPWLEPDISQAIRDLASKGIAEVIVAPIGFVCDHVEVLYDLDIEAKRVATGLGLNFIRVNCLNDHPTFIRMMAEMIEERVTSVKRRG
ncbi:MAG TPA: ferrochelatase [Candidatus Acidoferrales bacterium]|nr:ferrochelatase [Candidatus Acidoferrales bacterium]